MVQIANIKSIILILVFIFAVSAQADLYPVGDLNQDFSVDIDDLMIFAEQWMDESGCVPPNCAELDGLDGVTMSDFSMMSVNWLEDYGLPLVINEFMAANNSDSGIADPQGDYDDWLEIYNFGETAIDAGGMYLTDDPDEPTKWQFPTDRPAETTIQSMGFLVVWADEDVAETPGLHADFQLSSDGEEIGLFDTDGTTLIDSVSFGEQISNVSYGRWPDNSETLRYFSTATPGSANSDAYLGLIEDTKFSHDRGFYSAPFSLTITCTTPDADIYYTTDGSAPIENEMPAAGSIHYTGPIAISENACIRAAAIKTGWRPTNIDTHTYIFDASSEIKAMPVVCLVGDPDKTFWGPDGIMSHFTARGIEYERPVSFEIIDVNKGVNLQEDCGIRIHGSDDTRPQYTVGDDWSNCWDGNWPGMDTDKIGFNLWFRSDYGKNRLEYPFFPFSDVDRFKSIVLRQGKNDACTPFVKDEWARRLFQEIDHAQVTGTFANLYLNGELKSYYNPTARGDQEFYQEWYGTDNSFDVITQSDEWANEPRDGDLVAWNNLKSYVDSHVLSNTTNYEYVASQLDIPNFIDYLILEIHIGNFDWPNNNWDVHRERSEDGIFRFSVWDAEGMELWYFGANCEKCADTAFDDFPSYDPQGLNSGSWPICRIYRGLKANPEFRLLFADHVHKLFRNGGILSEAHLLQRWWEVLGEVSSVLPITEHYTVRFYPDVFIPNREPYVLAAFHDNDLFDLNFGYPIFNVNGSYQHGGYIPSDNTLTITQSDPSGTLYYTLDGNDPRVPATASQVSNEFILATEAASKKVLVPTGPLTGSTGSISSEYWFGITGTSVSDLTSNGNYPANPSSTGTLSSFEIPINWADNYGTRVRGYLHPPASGDYTFWIASDDSSELWLSSNDDPANVSRIAYVNGWTDSRVWTKYDEQESANISLTAGQTYYIEALQKEGTGGDNLAVSWKGPGFNQEVIDGSYLSPFAGGWAAVNFDDTSWTSGTGGVGYERSTGYESFIDIDVESEMYDHNGTCYIRIPFTVDGSELPYYGELTLRVRYDDGFIAYINGTEVQRVNFSGTPQWNSTADGGHEASAAWDSYDISTSIGTLRAGTNILAIQGLNNPTDSSDFLISAELEAVELGQEVPPALSASAIAYTGAFNLTASTELKARILNGTPETGQWSVLNEAVYGVGPVAQSLRISEIMYHPPDPNDEFIELINTGSESINLNLVRFTKGVDFTFGPESLYPDERILLVRDQASFMERYPAFTGRIAGEYDGKLDNAGEKIRLRDALDAIIHEFTYEDGWYDITDGEGFSLTIRNASATDPNLWDEKGGWRPSATAGGSPGTDDAGLLPEPGAIVINEVLAHSHELADWIELHNTTDGLINIGGWFLSDSNIDDPNMMKYEIPLGTGIPGNGYIVFYEDQHFGNPQSEGVNTPFALSEGGETVYLRSGSGGVIGGYEESEDFGASASNIAFGRHVKSTLDGGVNFVPMSANTPGTENAYPLVGPVVISELMYNTEAANTGGEYIELHNITDAAVTLQDSVSTETSPGVFQTDVVTWRFSDGIYFVFPADTTIPAYGYLIIAGDPSAFTNYYGAMAPGVDVLGPFENETALSNGGEQVQIVRPGDREYGRDRYWIRTERVTYDDDAPWPISADGDGDSLHQKTPELEGSNYGNDVINWQAAAPDPGQ